MTLAQMPQKAFPVSWDQFHRDARALAWRLNDAGPFEAIVTVTRGGLVPAAIVARELDVHLIETICISSYDHIRQGELRVLKGVASELVRGSGGGGKGVLIVDDLVDTGKTARVVRDLLPNAHFAPCTPSPWGGRWSIPSSPKCPKTPGYSSRGTPASPSSRRSAPRRGRSCGAGASRSLQPN